MGAPRGLIVAEKQIRTSKEVSGTYYFSKRGQSRLQTSVGGIDIFEVHNNDLQVHINLSKDTIDFSILLCIGSPKHGFSFDMLICLGRMQVGRPLTTQEFSILIKALTLLLGGKHE